MVLSVLLAAILDFLRDSWAGLRTWNSSKQKCYFEHESQVCVSAVHPDMMYNHDNWDLICYFGGHFVLQFWKGKTKNRAWHGAYLESAYSNCVKTTAWQILLRNALQTLRMPLFEKWSLPNGKYGSYIEWEKITKFEVFIKSEQGRSASILTRISVILNPFTLQYVHTC